MDPSKVPVEHRALTHRINRILAKDHRLLVKSRSRGEKGNLGDWYIVNANTNCVTASKCDIEELGREMGELKHHEYLVEG